MPYARVRRGQRRTKSKGRPIIHAAIKSAWITSTTDPKTCHIVLSDCKSEAEPGAVDERGHGARDSGPPRARLAGAAQELRVRGGVPGPSETSYQACSGDTFCRASSASPS